MCDLRYIIVNTHSISSWNKTCLHYNLISVSAMQDLKISYESGRRVALTLVAFSKLEHSLNTHKGWYILKCSCIFMSIPWKLQNADRQIKMEDIYAKKNAPDQAGIWTHDLWTDSPIIKLNMSCLLASV